MPFNPLKKCTIPEKYYYMSRIFLPPSFRDSAAAHCFATPSVSLQAGAWRILKLKTKTPSKKIFHDRTHKKSPSC